MVVGLNTGSILELGSYLFTPTLAQIVNVGFGPAGILGLGIACGGAALYFLRSVRPELARDHDIFFAAVGLLCGGILFFQGWRLDPILLFGQLLLTGASVFFAVESIRLRQVATTQAKRSTPIFEEDQPYPTQRDHYAELDEFEPAYDEPRPPRIRGTEDPSARRAYVDELAGENRSRRSGKRRSTSGSGTRKQRPRSEPPSSRDPRSPEGSEPTRRSPTSGYANPADTGTNRGKRASVNDERSNTRSTKGRVDSANRRSRPRPAPTPPDDYVDFQPIDYTDSEEDNSTNFDDFGDDKRS